jgi:iron complex outermembrane receptor protein
MNAVFFLAAASAALAAAVAPAGAQGSDATSSASRREQKTLEEIVVTARKREERLEDTPVSVTALGAAELRDAGVQRVDDLETLVPNLNFQLTSENAAANIRIRGIGTPQAVSIAFDPGVGVYVDGVFLPRTIGTLLDVVDIQQFEVLRGPQGTLFGKNTVGGAINITTVKPHDELEAFLLVRPGNREQVYTQAMLNAPIKDGPLADKLLTRFAFSTTNDRGYVYNRAKDQYWSDRSAVSFLGSLRYLLTDDVILDVSGSWSRDHNHGRGGRCVYVRDGAFASVLPELADECRRSRPFEIDANVDQISDIESYGTWGTGTWQIGDVGVVENLQVKSISSWREQIPRFRLDADMTRLAAVKRASFGGALSDGVPSFQKQVSTELQADGEAMDGRLSFVTGAFGMWEEGRDSTALEILPGILNSLTLNERGIANWNWALYGQGTLQVLEWLSLTGGVRFTEEKKGISALTTNLASPDAPPVLDLPSNRATFSAWTPTGSIQLSAPDRLLDALSLDHGMTYFTYSRGFRGGGFNGVINPSAIDLDRFEPEFLDSFEVGFKTIAFDDRATVNLAFFLSDYDDIQVTSQAQLDTDLNMDGVPDVEQTTLNAARATLRGAELELVTLPFAGALARGSIGLLETEYDDFGKGCFPGADANNVGRQCSFSDLDGGELDRSGESFNNAPKFQSNLTLQYSLPVRADGAWNGFVTPRLDWYYQTRVHFLGAEVAASRQRGYNLLGARLAYEFHDERAQIALWARNLTDEEYLGHVTPLITSFGVATQFYQSPRTYGGEISYRF